MRMATEPGVVISAPQQEAVMLEQVIVVATAGHQIPRSFSV
jgi:hypothetical protein